MSANTDKIPVSTLWTQKTGKSWKNAKSLGYTDGSYESNIKLRKDLISGKFDISTKSRQSPEFTGKTFSEAFTKARKELGKNHIFTWNNKQYGTNLSGEPFKPIIEDSNNNKLDTKKVTKTLNYNLPKKQDTKPKYSDQPKPEGNIKYDYFKGIEKLSESLQKEGSLNTPFRDIVVDGKKQSTKGKNCISGICQLLGDFGSKKLDYIGNYTFADNRNKEGYYLVDPNKEGFQPGDIIQYTKNSEDKKSQIPAHAKIILDKRRGENGYEYYVGHNKGNEDFIGTWTPEETLKEHYNKGYKEAKMDGLLINRYNPEKANEIVRKRNAKRDSMLGKNDYAKEYDRAVMNTTLPDPLTLFKRTFEDADDSQVPFTLEASSSIYKDVTTMVSGLTDIYRNNFKRVGKGANMPAETLNKIIKNQIGIVGVESSFGNDGLRGIGKAIIPDDFKYLFRGNDSHHWTEDYWNKNVKNIKETFSSYEDFKNYARSKGPGAKYTEEEINNRVVNSKASKGPFQQKELSQYGKVLGVDLSKDDLENYALGSLALAIDNYHKLKDTYGDKYNEDEIVDLVTLMHNAPSKALNPIFTEHYLKNKDVNYINRVKGIVEGYKNIPKTDTQKPSYGPVINTPKENLEKTFNPTYQFSSNNPMNKVNKIFSFGGYTSNGVLNPTPSLNMGTGFQYQPSPYFPSTGFRPNDAMNNQQLGTIKKFATGGATGGVPIDLLLKRLMAPNKRKYNFDTPPTRAQLEDLKKKPTPKDPEGRKIIYTKSKKVADFRNNVNNMKMSADEVMKTGMPSRLNMAMVEPGTRYSRDVKPSESYKEMWGKYGETSEVFRKYPQMITSNADDPENTITYEDYKNWETFKNSNMTPEEAGVKKLFMEDPYNRSLVSDFYNADPANDRTSFQFGTFNQKRLPAGLSITGLASGSPTTTLLRMSSYGYENEKRQEYVPGKIKMKSEPYITLPEKKYPYYKPYPKEGNEDGPTTAISRDSDTRRDYKGGKTNKELYQEYIKTHKHKNTGTPNKYGFGGDVKSWMGGNGMNGSMGALSMGAGMIGGMINQGDNPTGIGAFGGGALKGAAAGAQFGPWGAAIGGVIGGVGSLIGFKKQQKEEEKQERLEQEAKQSGFQQTRLARDTGALGTFPTLGVSGGMNYYAAMGGPVAPQYEAEGGEVIEHGLDPSVFEQNSDINPLAQGMSEIEGPSHEQGGVPMASQTNDFIYSNRLKSSDNLLNDLKSITGKTFNKGTYADVASKIGKLKGDYEEKIDSMNPASVNTGKLMLERLEEALELVKFEQEYRKQQRHVA